MISYGKQSIDNTDIDVVVDVFKSDWLTQGPKVEEFEQALKNKFGATYCCVVSNGTAALHLAGLALGWKPGDIVITSPITFLASANCIIYTGATPDFVDIDAISYTIDPNRLEERIKDYKDKGKKVKAVVAIDFSGHPCDWEALRTIADQYELKLINDNCHALGASYNGDTQYAVRYADVVTQSYHPVKHITTGEGGAILTNNLIIDEKVRCLRNHGMIKDPNQLTNNHGPWYYEMHDLGYNYRITDFQCALGISQLRKLDAFLERRRKIAQKYNKAFQNDDRFIVPSVSKDVRHAYHLYPLQVKFEGIVMNRTQLFKEVRKKGIKLQVHYIPMHLQPYYNKCFGFNPGDFPVAMEFYSKEISLPIYFSLNEEDVELIISTLKDSIV